MNHRVKLFFDSIKGKKIAFVGIGVSNLPLTLMFAQKGATVYACDRKSREQLGSAADEMERAGVELRLGETYLDNLDVNILFRAPGMYYNLPVLQEFRKKGVVVTSEMEVFFDLCPAKTYAVTGSDGKTTTTTLIAKMLASTGKKVYLGGNIGKALLPLVEEMTEDDYAVVELSSFQLISMRKSPEVAVITNVTPNHLDVHKDMKEYTDSKINLIAHQNAFTKAVLNLDNNVTASLQSTVRGDLRLFSRQNEVQNGAYLKDGKIFYVNHGKSVEVMDANDIRIPGVHNIENYMAAICAVIDIVPIENITEIAKTFGGVEHRIEYIRTLDGVRYYNDSIATSPSRTIAGLKAFGKKIIIIAGGSDKNIPYEPLGPYINQYVKTLILIGTTAKKIEQATVNDASYDPDEITIVHKNSLEEAVEYAHSVAKDGDVVSLNPASASFDMFPNYETRGEIFKELVNNLK